MIYDLTFILRHFPSQRSFNQPQSVETLVFTDGNTPSKESVPVKFVEIFVLECVKGNLFENRGFIGGILSGIIYQGLTEDTH